jgi:hypothetical protein
MKAINLIETLFVKNDGVTPKNIIVSDHFAMGCWLIIKGNKSAGLKLISGALSLMECKTASKVKQIQNFVAKNPTEAFKTVQPHAEVLALINAIRHP